MIRTVDQGFPARRSARATCDHLDYYENINMITGHAIARGKPKVSLPRRLEGGVDLPIAADKFFTHRRLLRPEATQGKPFQLYNTTFPDDSTAENAENAK